MSDTMEQAAELTNKYEESLMPSQEEAVKINEFFNALEELQNKFDKGEINREEQLALVDDARKKISISTSRVLGGLVTENRNYDPNDEHPHVTTDNFNGPAGIYDLGDPMDNPEDK